MPLSTFDGEPTVTKQRHYDATGKLTGATVTTTPGWSVDDRAWALGLTLREANQCPRGHDLTESLDEESWKWVAHTVTCLACVATEGSIKSREKDPDHRSMLHSVHKVPRPKPSKRRR